jgi:hypothetical protein
VTAAASKLELAHLGIHLHSAHGQGMQAEQAHRQRPCDCASSWQAGEHPMAHGCGTSDGQDFEEEGGTPPRRLDALSRASKSRDYKDGEPRGRRRRRRRRRRNPPGIPSLLKQGDFFLFLRVVCGPLDGLGCRSVAGLPHVAVGWEWMVRFS